MAILLFVEDDPLIRHNLPIVLAAAGHRVVVAATAAEGYRAAHEQTCDLLLLDIGLPDESGLDLARRLRKAQSQAPIIFVTAYENEELIQASIACQAHSYLVKPISARQLLPVIETALAASRNHTTREAKLVAALNIGRETSIAVGILAERQQCSPEAAFEELRHQARSRKMRIETRAQEIIDGQRIGRNT